MATIFSNRNISLLLFIIIALFLGASFNVHVGPESFGDSEDDEEGSVSNMPRSMTPTPSMTPSMTQMGSMSQ